MPKHRKKLLLVDGYNVLRSARRYQRIAGPAYTDDTFNTAREAQKGGVAPENLGQLYEGCLLYTSRCV